MQFIAKNYTFGQKTGLGGARGIENLAGVPPLQRPLKSPQLAPR